MEPIEILGLMLISNGIGIIIGATMQHLNQKDRDNGN